MSDTNMDTDTLHSARNRHRPLASGRLLLASLLALLAVAGCGDPQLVLPETISIVAIEPNHGAVGIGVSVTAVVVLSHPLASELDLDKYFVLSRKSDAQELVTTLALSGDGHTVTIDPDADLELDTSYRITVTAKLRGADDDIKPLPVDVSADFDTITN